ncbi:MAG: response regulator transcription factor [Clostridia bacterium]|nr:response regulator transcription factor [Clostridia bacterium]
MTQNKEVRIMIADDNPDVHEILTAPLEAEGYEIIHAYDGREVLENISKEVSLCLLDVMMPEISGIDACKEIRKTSRVPIIMISARGEEIDKIIGIELGADDYIVKPFSTREVVARVKAVLRRCSEKEQLPNRNEISVGGLEIDVTRYSVTLMGERISCTPKELEILYILASNPGQVYTRNDLLTNIWGYEFAGETRTVDTHIKRIRAKLEKPGFKWAIKTIYGVGYKFDQK